MGYNLPPGVTGREYRIAGPDYEREEDRTCGEQDRPLVVTPHGFPQFTFEVEATCPFEGEVLVTGFGNERWWTCPVCAFEHEEEYDPEPPEREPYDD